MAEALDFADLGKQLCLEIVIRLGLQELCELDEVGRFFVQVLPGALAIPPLPGCYRMLAM